MKKLSKVTLGSILLFMFLAIVSFLPIKAETKLTKDVEKKIDLDGDGNKEKIIFSYTENEYVITNANVKLNGSKVFSYKSDGEYPEYYYFRVKVIDINPSDQYKELVIDLDAEFENQLYVYRLKNNKLKLLFKEDSSYSSYDFIPDQTAGNKVLMYSDAFCALGNNVYIIKNYKIKNKKLVEVKPKSQIYNVESNRWDTEETWYKAAKNITVYKNSDGKKAVSTIKAGTEFKLTKIKYVNDVAVYAQIMVKGEKKSKGWINVKYYEGCEYEDKMVESPAFAG